MNKIEPVEMVEQPASRTFSTGELAVLRTQLEEMDQHTIRVPISAPSDIELDGTCCLKESGFRLSPLALQHICKYTARGLWSLTTDIGGATRTARSFDQVISVPLAAQLINSCTKLRFRAVDGICGRHMIQDHLTKTVDGVVGPRYHLLPNHQLLCSAIELMADHEIPMVFHSGELIGRRMSLTFLASKAIGQLATGEHLFGGCYLTNSEAGECGVRGALVLQVAGTQMRCQAPMRRIAHAGKKFMMRLGRMLTAVLGRWEALKETAQDTAHLSDPLMTFTGGKLDTGRRRRIESRLAKNMDTALAEHAMRQALFMGAEGTVVPKSVTQREIACRTVRDLFIILMRLADGQYPDVREALERTAFEVLNKKIQL